MENIISFIYCVNNESIFRNSLQFLTQLKVPNGYEIEVIQVNGATSAANGYNKGMKKAKGKYKVYLHQDVYIINTNFIENILKLFKDKEIGLIGLAGSKDIPADLVWWNSHNVYGWVYEIRKSPMRDVVTRNPVGEYEEVSLLDGLILITQYDIPWREDIFDGWHFYDISQSIEFLKASKKVIVPKQSIPWVIHDCGENNLTNYDLYRERLYKEYFSK